MYQIALDVYLRAGQWIMQYVVFMLSLRGWQNEERRGTPEKNEWEEALGGHSTFVLLERQL